VRGARGSRKGARNAPFAPRNPHFVAPRWPPAPRLPRVHPSTRNALENRMNAFALLMSLTFFAPIALNVAMNVVGLRGAD
jgi:hypothetical protein